MTPLVRELLCAALGLVQRPGNALPDHLAARRAELRLLLTEADREAADWPTGAKALVELLRAVAAGHRQTVPPGIIAAVCDDRWPRPAADEAMPKRLPGWVRRADCGGGF